LRFARLQLRVIRNALPNGDQCTDRARLPADYREEELTMKYILLLYGNEGEWANASPAETEQSMREFGAVYSELLSSGRYKGGDPLMSTEHATTIEVRNGKTVKRPGPFARTSDQLGGYVVIDAASVDDAAAIAARLPSARVGCVEIRPIMDIPRP
jgi:hypothetical protein